MIQIVMTSIGDSESYIKKFNGRKTFYDIKVSTKIMRIRVKRLILGCILILWVDI